MAVKDSVNRWGEPGQTQGRKPKLLDMIEVAGPPGPDGRPTRIPQRRDQAILDAIAAGSYLCAAAGAYGVSDRALLEWQQKGQADLRANRDTIYARFAHDLTRAEWVGELALIADIRAAAKDKPGRPGDWRAALALLERRHAKRWAQVDRIELSGRDGEPLIPPEVADRAVLEAAREIEDRRAAGDAKPAGKTNGRSNGRTTP